MSNSKIRAALRQKEVQRQRQGSRRALLTASHHLQIAQIALDQAKAALGPRLALSPLWHLAQASAETLGALRCSVDNHLARLPIARTPKAAPQQTSPSN